MPRVGCRFKQFKNIISRIMMSRSASGNPGGFVKGRIRSNNMDHGPYFVSGLDLILVDVFLRSSGHRTCWRTVGYKSTKRHSHTFLAHGGHQQATVMDSFTQHPIMAGYALTCEEIEKLVNSIPTLRDEVASDFEFEDYLDLLWDFPGGSLTELLFDGKDGKPTGVIFTTRGIPQGSKLMDPTKKDKRALEKFILAIENAGGKLDRNVPEWRTLYPKSKKHPKGYLAEWK
ncbi:hypothetical protein DL96DRAFT_1860 [Flagelloscypha sp. PMI_526]|nr:hypothetical protein DL96DRAFT_1860 [Flagelloscypha sp. PMI_526]